MSTTNNYIPNADADKGIWMSNFNAKIPGYVGVLSVTPADILAFQQDTNMFQYVINMAEVFKQTLNNITAYKQLMKHAGGQQHLGYIPTLPALATPPAGVPEGIFDRVSKLVKRIKTDANYTEAIGHDLGIIAVVQSFNAEALKPDLRVTLDAGRPHIKCTKGYADAVDLYADRRDNAGFVLIGRLTKPDFIDAASLPANTVITEWDYKAMYVIDNNSVGLMSAVVSVVVKKM